MLNDLMIMILLQFMMEYPESGGKEE